MRKSRSFAAPWRAVSLAVAVLALGVPAARAAIPADLVERPYIVMVDGRPADAPVIAANHSRRFGAAVSAVFDRLGGYAATMTAREAKKLAREPGVTVAPDLIVTGYTDQRLTKDQIGYMGVCGQGEPNCLGTLWGLDRVDQPARPLDNRYSYARTGAGVTAYVIDSGVRSTHREFQADSGSRVTVRKDFVADPKNGNGPGEDCFGHGTHVAGILGGKTFGVAKDVNIVSVKVLNCSNSGTTSGVIAGLNWVTANRVRPAVANLSLGGGANVALDQAVQRSIDAGVTFAIAAGNGSILGSGTNACNLSPARVKGALTVGATDINDKRATWSNHGSCVDVYAPGNAIVSSWCRNEAAPVLGTPNPDHDSAWKVGTGTSMAAPAVAGVAALLLEIEPDASPAQVSKALTNLATPGIITGTNVTGARLVHAPVTGDEITRATADLTTVISTPPAPAPPPPTCLLCGLFG